MLNKETDLFKDNTSFISSYINAWFHGDIKSLAILSTYDTGKTRLIKNLIKEFGFKKVLFISYRQTLTNELHGSFKELYVDSYLDGVYGSDRIICQIESLEKLLPKFQFIDQTNELPTYDLIVLDEIESILNHFRSSTIANKEKTFNFMKDLVFNSTKVLALDGDFHNRSYHFLKHFGDLTILHNEVKKNLKHFLLTNNRNHIENNIDNDLKNGKNIVIVSMSSKLATYFYNKYKDHYKTVLHCSKSDDQNKEKLKEVNTFWKQFELVIYSPSIESGVNMDSEHFFKIYVVLSPKSTSPRGLMQMIGRVRKLEDSNVMVYLNNMPFKEKSNFYTYDELKEYISEVYSNYLEPKTALNVETNKMTIMYTFDLYAQILVHNETENANKTRNLFVPYFIKLLTNKGHTFEHIEIKKKKNAYNKDSLTKDEILNTKDIDQDTFHELLSKQMNNQATKQDKLEIERYVIKIDWKIDEITNDFLSKFYGKTYVLYNLRFLLDKSLLNPYIEKNGDKHSIDFDLANTLEQINMIDEVLKKLGFDKPGDGRKLEKNVFQENIKCVLTECQLFVNINKSQPMFGYDKSKIGKLDTVRSVMGFLNSLFKEWGICIRCCKKNIKINKKYIKHLSYELLYINGIQKYI